MFKNTDIAINVKKKRSSNFVQKYTYEPIENKIINLMADI